jgi:5-methylthioadenosine/S-adenosylhomocysteine deaminase
MSGDGVTTRRLLHASVIITMNPDREVLRDGAVLIDGIRLADVGELSEIRARHPDASVERHPHAVMLPGLIDSHGHAGHALVRTLGLGVDGGWADACEEIYTRASSEEFWRADAYVLGLERLRAGITTGVTLLGGGGQILTGDMPLRTDSPAFAEAHAEAASVLGAREWIVVGPRRPPFPRRYTQRIGGDVQEVEVEFADQLDVCETVIRRLDGAADGRVRIALTTHTIHPEQPGETQQVRDEMTSHSRVVRALAREHGLPFMQDGHTRTTVRYAQQCLGGLGPDVFLAHATDLDRDEIELCADTGCVVVHNPSAIASALGRCPVPELIEAGATVVIGTDGPGPDRACDLFRQMFQCARAQRAHRRDPTVMPEGKLLEMVTIDAARALGVSDELGSLEAGKRADLILLDADAPHLTPLTMPVHQIVHFATPGDVEKVVVDGLDVIDRRRVISVDEHELLASARSVWQQTLELAELEGLSLPPQAFWGGARSMPRPAGQSRPAVAR